MGTVSQTGHLRDIWTARNNPPNFPEHPKLESLFSSLDLLGLALAMLQH
jgi:hypothetical protein